MKKINRVVYIIASLLLIITVLLINNSKLNNKLKDSYNISADYKFKYKTYKDSFNREHALYTITKGYRNSLNSEHKELLNDVSKQLNVDKNKIISVTKLSTSTVAPFKINIDTPNFNDGYLSLNTNNKDGVIVGTYTYKDTCWTTSYTTNKTFLGFKYNNKTNVDIHFGNPNTQISGLTSFTIEDYIKPKHWSVGPYIGVQYYDYKIRPSIGISVQYILFKF